MLHLPLSLTWAPCPAPSSRPPLIMRRHATAPGRTTACASHADAGPSGGQALRGNVEEVPQLATHELGGDLREVPTAA